MGQVPCTVMSSGKVLRFVVMKGKIIVAVIRFQSCKILFVSILNLCAVFWHLISFKCIDLFQLDLPDHISHKVQLRLTTNSFTGI